MHKVVRQQILGEMIGLRTLSTYAAIYSPYAGAQLVA